MLPHYLCHCIRVKMKMFESLSMERIYGKEAEIPSKPQLPRDSVAIKVVVGCSTVHWERPSELGMLSRGGC